MRNIRPPGRLTDGYRHTLRKQLVAAVSDVLRGTFGPAGSFDTFEAHDRASELLSELDTDVNDVVETLYARYGQSGFPEYLRDTSITDAVFAFYDAAKYRRPDTFGL